MEYTSDYITQTIVAVDLGTKSGIAWRKDDEISSMPLDFTKVKQMGAGMRPYMLRKELLKLFHALDPVDLVVFENVQKHSATYAAQIYGELRGCLMMVCEELSIPYRGIGVTTVKKHVTGRGLCKKDVTRKYVKEIWPALFKSKLSEDEVDALSILKCGIDDVY
mgnify:CR=1 FL=1